MPDAPLLNSWISRAAGARALLQLHSEHGASMDAMHIGNLWNKLGRQTKHLAPTSASAVVRLADATCNLVASCSRADVLANVAHGAAQVGSLDAINLAPLFDCLASVVPRALHRCEPRHLANIAWSFASAGRLHVAVFDAIAAATSRARLASFNGQELGMVAWAFARVDHPGLTTSLVEVAAMRATELDPQALSTLAASLVKLGAARAHDRRSSVGLKALKRLARAARSKVGSFNHQDLDNIASAYAKLGRPGWGGKLASAIARAAVERLAGGFAAFPSRSLANVLWGVAKMASSCKLARGAVVSEPHVVELCAAASRTMLRRIGEFNARDLSNAAWAFLIVGRFERATMLAIAQRSAETLGTFNAQETSKLLYAMRKAGVHCAALEEEAAKPREHTLDIAPHKGPPIHLTHLLGGGRFGAGASSRREETGATAATGGALWEGSLLLAKWLAAHPTPSFAAASLPPIGARLLRSDAWAGSPCLEGQGGATQPATWVGRTAVELGAGLGLPSIIAGRLGLRAVATDSDGDVLALLESNTTRDSTTAARLRAASSGGGGGGRVSGDEGSGAGAAVAAAVAEPVRVQRLKWGEDADPLGSLGLGEPPNVLLAVDVVYGKEEKVWKALVQTLVALAGEHTLVLMAHGNGAAPGIHNMGGRFYEMAAAHFESECLPPDPEHPGCQIHCLVRRGGGAAGSGRAQHQAKASSSKKRARAD
jgi:predicted nicotinamide N-methyase